MRARRFLSAAAFLGLLWVLLSGESDAFHLGAGLVAACAVAALRARSAEPPPFPLLRFLAFLPWLVLQTLVSNLKVTRLVFSRRPLSPRFVETAPGVGGDLALALLGASITLTPGTVTVEAEEGRLEVHALDEAAARDIEQGVMAARVRRVFGQREPA